ncbi:MAG TPA: ABC-type transport auxiliary lipoprotein family protein [Azospirillaceae bacterium]|nr:ABC-type transport auxiliary lipoprotein family protein [Azospirillaceae bacterium]
MLTRGLRAGLLTLGLVALGACSLVPGLAPQPRVFKLAPANETQAGTPVGWQLLVATPQTVAMLNSTRIVLREQGGHLDYFADVEWAAPLPELMQGLLIESLENTGRIESIARETSGLRADYLLMTEIHEFQAEYLNGEPEKTIPVVRVRLTSKLVRMPRRVIEASQTFEASVRAAGPTMVDIVEAYNTAFQDCARRLGDWALNPGQRLGGGT